MPREPTSLCGLETAMQAHPIRAKHKGGDGGRMFKELAAFIDGQTAKVEHAQRTWIAPYAWEVDEVRMAAMREEIARARRQIIELAKRT